MPFYEDLSKIKETGYRVARWHPNGKLYISPTMTEEYSTTQKIVKEINELVTDLPHDPLNQGYGRYFTWHSDLSTEDLEAWKAQSHTDKIN